MSKNIFSFSPDDSFEEEVIKASNKNPVMTDYFATWCGPCRKLSPLLETAAEKYGFKLVTIDVDKNNQLATKHNVRGIPQVNLYHKGTEVMKFVGFDKDSLERMINYIKSNSLKFTGKGVSIGGNAAVGAKAVGNIGNIPEEPPEGDDTYEIAFKYNADTFTRRFLGDHTIGEVKNYVKSKVRAENISIFTPFPRKVYDNNSQTIKEAGLSKREMLNVCLV